jgi:hypothetical protein
MNDRPSAPNAKVTMLTALQNLETVKARVNDAIRSRNREAFGIAEDQFMEADAAFRNALASVCGVTADRIFSALS